MLPSAIFDITSFTFFSFVFIILLWHSSIGSEIPLSPSLNASPSPISLYFYNTIALHMWSGNSSRILEIEVSFWLVAGKHLIFHLSHYFFWFFSSSFVVSCCFGILGSDLVVHSLWLQCCIREHVWSSYCE